MIYNQVEAPVEEPEFTEAPAEEPEEEIEATEDL